MSHRCLIVDDESLARELLVRHVENVAELSLAGVCASALEARASLRERRVDLLLLDIEMPLLKGTDFLRHLRNPPAVIFTTAYRNYAVDGFELEAVDYLLKPITFERFLAAVEKYLRQAAPNNVAVESKPDFVFLRKDRKRVRLDLATVDYVESQKDYALIHCGSETLRVKYPLGELADILGNRFLRIHRSFLVHIARVTAVGAQDVELGRRELPIGEFYRSGVRKRLLG